MDQIINLRKKFQSRENSSFENGDVSWEADYSEYISPMWQAGVMFFLIGILIFLIFLKQGFITISFFTLLAVVFLIRLKKAPKSVSVFFYKKHIALGKKIIPYNELRSFWISYEPSGLKELSVLHKTWHSSYIKIPLGDRNPLQIRDFLLNYVPEDRHENNIFDIFSKKIGV